MEVVCPVRHGFTARAGLCFAAAGKALGGLSGRLSEAPLRGIMYWLHHLKFFSTLFVRLLNLDFYYEHFFLFSCKQKRKKRSQRKRKHAVFLCPSGILFKWLLRASPHSFTSQTRDNVPQTMLGILHHERVRSTIANIKRFGEAK